MFFGAADGILDAKDVTYETEVDAEIIGAGTVMAFTVITPMILLAYSIYGADTIQATSLDALFCFVGSAMLVTSGSKTMYTDLYIRIDRQLDSPRSVFLHNFLDVFQQLLPPLCICAHISDSQQA